MWELALPRRWIIHCLFVDFFYAAHGWLKERRDNQRARLLCARTRTHSERQRSSSHLPHVHSRTLAWMCTPTITQIYCIWSCSALWRTPLRSQFISDCQLFGSEPSLIMRILHPASLLCVQRPLCSPEYMKAKPQEIHPFSIKPWLADYY